MARCGFVLRGLPGTDAAGSARRILDAGFEGVGLEHPLHPVEWESLRPLLPREKALSIQLFLPCPRALHPGAPCPFVLGSPRQEDKRDALAQGRETLTFADRHAIPVVRVPPASMAEDLRLEWPPGPVEDGALVEWMAGAEKRRRQLAAPRFDAFLSVLGKLLSFAERFQVRLALTPGGPLDEIPNSVEVATCFREFEGAPLAAWPDTLRWAQARAVSRLYPQPQELLGERSQGILVRDFDAGKRPVPLGRGELEGGSFLPILQTIPVWVADPPLQGAPTEDGLRESLDRLQSLGRKPDTGEGPGFRLF